MSAASFVISALFVVAMLAIDDPDQSIRLGIAGIVFAILSCADRRDAR